MERRTVHFMKWQKGQRTTASVIYIIGPPHCIQLMSSNASSPYCGSKCNTRIGLQLLARFCTLSNMATAWRFDAVTVYSSQMRN